MWNILHYFHINFPKNKTCLSISAQHWRKPRC